MIWNEDWVEWCKKFGGGGARSYNVNLTVIGCRDPRARSCTQRITASLIDINQKSIERTRDSCIALTQIELWHRSMSVWLTMNNWIKSLTFAWSINAKVSDTLSVVSFTNTNLISSDHWQPHWPLIWDLCQRSQYICYLFIATIYVLCHSQKNYLEVVLCFDLYQYYAGSPCFNLCRHNYHCNDSYNKRGDKLSTIVVQALNGNGLECKKNR